MPLADYTKCRLTELYNTMNKKLKIKFWKPERVLVMQILEQEGLPELKGDGKVRIANSPALYYDMIYLRGREHAYDFLVENYYFGSNQDRDECLDRLVNAITNELFASKGEVKIGELCEMSDDKLVWEVRRFAGKSAKQLGLEKRFLAVCNNDFLTRYAYVRPLIKCTEPKVEEDGEIVTYTWEEK